MSSEAEYLLEGDYEVETKEEALAIKDGGRHLEYEDIDWGGAEEDVFQHVHIDRVDCRVSGLRFINPSVAFTEIQKVKEAQKRNARIATSINEKLEVCFKGKDEERIEFLEGLLKTYQNGGF